ncbi:Chromatin modification-related protein EAF3 [Rhodotorula toruloides ATCC 204091]|nr:Chromatin modification-related protein EAF3 [Rhodotorula toruloides ATCC 204091]
MQPPPPARKRNTVPVCLVLPAGEPLVEQYSAQVISYIRLTRPSRRSRFTLALEVRRMVYGDEEVWVLRLTASIRRQRDLGAPQPLCEAMRGNGWRGLLVSCVVPSAHALPLNPFLPPEAFLSALPTYVRHSNRSSTSLWRSSTGLLRAIRLARRRLVEGSLAGAGGEGRAQLPKYVVVITADDIENMGGDEVWLEDDDQGETWESFAKNFTRGPHCTTLFSLISFSYTPNLEAFWKESSGRFPANLVYNSLSPPLNTAFSFPLLSPSHACFLIGFYNNNARPPLASQPSSGTPSPANTAKRPAPPDATAANKKAKPNPPISASPQLPSAKPIPTPPNPSRTPVQVAAALQSSPPLAAKPSPNLALSHLPLNVNMENVEQFIEEVKAAAARAGKPPPSAADLQAIALAAYNNVKNVTRQTPSSTATASSTITPATTAPSQTPSTTNTTPRATPTQFPPLNQMTRAQIDALPQIPVDMRAKIEATLEGIRRKVERGQLTQEQAHMQVKQLQELANQQRLRLAQHQAASEHAANGSSGQGLGLNIPVAASSTVQPAQQQPPPLQRKDSQRVIWRGPISWAFSDASGGPKKTELTVFTSAVPMQQSAVKDLAEVKLPQIFRVSNFMQIKIAALQELANKHTLPAISMIPIPSSNMPQDLRDKQAAAPGGHSNESLYRMFAESLETRQNCGIVRFSGTPNGLVLVPVPGQSKLIGLVFAKIPLPEAWFKRDESVAQARQQQQQQQPKPTPAPQPPQQNASTGMFSSPVAFNLQLPTSMPSQSQQPAPFATSQAPPQLYTPAPTQPFTLQQPPPANVQRQPQPQPQPQAPPPPQMQQQIPTGEIAGMGFAELQQLLGPEQFAQIMSGLYNEGLFAFSLCFAEVNSSRLASFCISRVSPRSSRVTHPAQVERRRGKRLEVVVPFVAHLFTLVRNLALAFPLLPALPKLAYAENEKALCFHGPLMYEAKVLKAEFWQKGSNKSGAVGPHYFVHYKGWKQTWDEWVPEERLNKWNEENIRKQKALIEAQRARDAAEREAAKAEEAAKAKGGMGPGAMGGRGTARGQKRGREGETEDEYMKRPEIKISIPDNLKIQLVDDWEAITKNQQLVPLPRVPNVDVILDEWLIYLQNEEEEKKRIAAEVAAGIGLYFNKALGNNLLYRFERGQYQEQYKRLQGSNKGMSSVYGGEHLLRLFVNLPELLAHTSLDPESMAVLKDNIQQFLQWMDLNRRVLFLPEYIGTSSGYQNNNRG